MKILVMDKRKNCIQMSTVNSLSTLFGSKDLESISLLPYSSDFLVKSNHLLISTQLFKELILVGYECINKHGYTCSADFMIILAILNPDDSRLWVQRRKSCLKGAQDKLQLEISVCKYALMVKPKSSEPFLHLQWLLSQDFIIPIRNDISMLLNLCCNASLLYKNNYFAWKFRMWLIENYGFFINWDDELSWSRNWTTSHVSDHSGMHYRFRLLLNYWQSSKVIDLSNNIGIEMLFICGLVKFYKASISLWAYLRQLVVFTVDKKLELSENCKTELFCITSLNIDNKIKEQITKKLKLLKC